MRKAIVVGVLILLVARTLAAQPTTLTVTPLVVVPGTSVTARITGPPGYVFGLVGSPTGAGAVYGGVNLAVGADLVVIAMGTLDSEGRAAVLLTPPFLGSILDRLYLQAGTSISPAFLSFTLSAGQILKNADLVGGLDGTGPEGPPGPTGAAGPAGAVGATGAGVEGPAGVAGPVGPNGPPGAGGGPGATGVAGSAGPTGAVGPTGAAGPTGAEGPAGVAGATGATGSAGAPGTDGATGAGGSVGPTGAAGATGPAGLTFLGAWSGATAYVANDAVFQSSAGSSYISLANNVNQPPDISPASWSLLAAGAAPVSFADFYALMPTDNPATVAAGSALQLPRDGPSSGPIVRLSPSTFSLPPGIYKVTFQASVTEAGQLVLALDTGTGPVEFTPSAVGRATGTSQIGGTLLIEIIETSILSLRNPVLHGGVLTLTPSAGTGSDVSAHLVITRVQ
jgi:hypothetical protein